MSIVVNPHDQQQERALLAFLDKMQYDYTRTNNAIVLSEAQQQEILERDRLYEAGETESFTLDEIINYFGIKE
jgi:hypothetical protein